MSVKDALSKYVELQDAKEQVQLDELLECGQIDIFEYDKLSNHIDKPQDGVNGRMPFYTYKKGKKK